MIIFNRNIKKYAFLICAFTAITVSAGAQSALRELQSAFREVSSKVLPVVVDVDTVSIVERQTVNPFEFFFRFPNMPNQPDGSESFRREGLGSGVLVERRGNTVYVLTNNHVITGADEININLNDGRTFSGELVGGDQLRDLALVSFDVPRSEDIPLATLGDSDDVWVGDWVLAVGNPLGYESSVTAGIISAKGRNASGQNFTDYLQTDASINQGNSGGALVNIDGEVIGINTFIASNSGGNIGLGFAIPINNARQAIDDFIEKGSVQYAWLGVSMIDLNDTLAQEMNLENRSGAFVHGIYGDSPAMNNDIRPGDLITSMAGRTIEGASDLVRTVAALSPDQSVPVTLIRGGRTVTLNLTLDVRTIEGNNSSRVDVWPGFSTVPITQDIRDRIQIPRNAGNLMIDGVVDSSQAASLGLRRGDIIKSINRRNVRSLNQFFEMISSEDRIELAITRQGEQLEFILNK